MKAKNGISKVKMLFVYLTIVLFGLGTAALATTTAVPAGGTEIESDTSVANVTAGHTQYYGSVDANINDVVKVQVWYHNKEGSTSGKNANDLNVKVNLPSTDQTAHVITSVVGGTNTNVITNTTAVQTSTATTLQYIPGTAFRKYNSGTNEAPNIVTVAIADGVVTGNGFTIPAMKPCWNFEETITVQARVMAPVVSITKRVRVENTGSYVTNLVAQSGSKLDYAFEIKNEGNVTLNNVIVRDKMPDGISFVPGSVSIISALYPSGKTISDGIFTNGSAIGDFTPGANAVITFKAVVSQTLTAGDHTFTNYSYVRSDELSERYNVAIVTVHIEGKGTPLTPVCTIYATPGEINNGSSATLTFSSLNATSGSIGGIGSVGLSGTKLVSPTATTTYTYTVVNQDGSAFCNTVVKVINPTPPTKPNLPESGPAEAAAGAAGLTLTGGAGYAWLKSKKALLSALKKVK